MKKIVFHSLFMLVAGLSVAATPAMAQGEQPEAYQAGLHYTEIDQASELTGDTVLVEELFSYLCTHCNTFEPYIESWKARKPDHVEFRRIPVVFGRSSWEIYARGVVTAEMMDIPEEAHMAMMDRLWKEKKIMRSMDEIAEFYTQFGVEKDKFLSTSRSFAVDGKLRKDQLLVQKYGIRGTPSVVVAGKYRVAGNAAVPSFDVMLDVVDFLIKKESANTPAP